MADAEEKIIYEANGLESTAYELGDGDYTVAVVCQNHGDEKGPRQVFEELLDENLIDNYDDLNLSFVPEANVFASEHVQRKTPRSYQPNSADQKDLNRCYNTALQELESENPDITNLNLTQQAAFHVLSYLDDLDPDLVLDMHTGTSGTVKMPQTRYKHSESFSVKRSEMRDLVENSGVDFIASEGDHSGSEVLGAVMPKTGVPALTIEVGGGVENGWTHSFSDEYADSYREIIENILDYAVAGETSNFTGREFNELKKRHTSMDMPEGEIRYNFDLGDAVEEGDEVAVLETDEGDFSFKASDDGVLETVLTEDMRDSVKPGNRIFNVARGDL